MKRNHLIGFVLALCLIAGACASGTEKADQATAPVTLSATASYPDGELTAAGIVKWTNLQRSRDGLGSLSRNSTLDRVAEVKMADMFTRQYFGHDAPTGERVGDLAEAIGYEFGLVGENLAMGYFGDDNLLVLAWMGSPGHRASILHGRYEEIGVAVGKSEFNGEATWIAVQTFGTPLPVCPGADEALRTEIDEQFTEIARIKTQLDEARDALNNIPGTDTSYSAAARAFNTLVEQYNLVLEKLTPDIENYNGQLETLNECLAG